MTHFSALTIKMDAVEPIMDSNHVTCEWDCNIVSVHLKILEKLTMDHVLHKMAALKSLSSYF